MTSPVLQFSPITKPALNSVAVWGGIIVVAVQFFVLGSNILDGFLGRDAQVATAVVSIIGGGLAIWGRCRARHIIDGVVG